MKEHYLKIWPLYFADVQKRLKNFEVRKDDRNYSVGDVLILQEYIIKEQKYTGNEIKRVISYKLSGGQFGIEPGYCILGLDSTGNKNNC
jgi:hypothetical protein